jgi:hypothetical protein
MHWSLEERPNDHHPEPFASLLKLRALVVKALATTQGVEPLWGATCFEEDCEHTMAVVAFRGAHYTVSIRPASEEEAQPIGESWRTLQ